MADMYTPQEIQDIFDRYNAALRAGIPINESLAREMADATKGVKNYTAALNANLKLLGQATKQAARDLTNGAKGASVFNESVEATGNVLSTVASQFGVLGKGISLAIGALSSFITAVNKQSDALYGTFQQLSRSGVIGAQGMDDVFQSMLKFGYTIDQLDKMSAVLIENSKNFALFSGTAATGANSLADMVRGMEESRVKFFNLGLTVDDIVRGGAGYYRQLGVLGRTNQATVAGAKEYIRELEIMTRLTGLQRRELEEAREQAENVDQFFAALMDMNAVNPEAAKNADRIFKALYAQDPKRAIAFAKSMDGIIDGSEEQSQALMATNGNFIDLAMAVKQGSLDFTGFMQAYSDAIRPNIDLNRQLAKIGVTDYMGALKSNVIGANKGLNPFTNQLAAANKEVTDLENGANAATDAQSRMRNSQINISNAMQEFINSGINPVTKAFQILTEVVEALTTLLPFSGTAKARYEQEQKQKSAAKLAAQPPAAAPGAAGAAGAAGTATAPVSLLDKIIQAESGGRNIGNTGGSSAFGIAQIMPDTFKGLVRNATRDSPLYGKTFEDMKADVGLQRAALAQLTAENQSALTKAGHAVTEANTYLAHFLGGPTAVKVLNAPDSMNVSSVLSAKEINSNPQVLKAMTTVGDLKAWAQKKMGAAGPSGAFGWQGTISGPMSGYNPNITMHGTEQLSIRPAGPGSMGELGSNTTELFGKMVERLDEMIYLSRNQLGVNEKILKYQQ